MMTVPNSGWIYSRPVGEILASTVADPGFTEGGFRTVMRAMSARKTLGATPTFDKPRPQKSLALISKSTSKMKNCTCNSSSLAIFDFGRTWRVKGQNYLTLLFYLRLGFGSRCSRVVSQATPFTPRKGLVKLASRLRTCMPRFSWRVNRQLSGCDQ